MFENIQRGNYLIGDREMFFRSKWEANYALYLNFLKKQGQIKDWSYETTIFEFPIKHGTTRYMPDFVVTENDDSKYYVEVKGYLTSKAKTQLKRMAKYHPKAKIVMVNKDEMKALKKWSKLLKFY